MRNALSVDVEDWFQVGAFEKVIDKGDWPRLESRVARNTDAVLDLFARAGVKATFFTLGWVAERAPAQMRRIVAEGHEIASHGWDHDRVFTLTPEQFRADLRRARAALEDASGAKVTGYRAPSFSIDTRTPWAHQVLAEEGYAYSSSVAPVRHDHYGWPEAPRFAFCPIADANLIELPVTTARIGGRSWSTPPGRMYAWFIRRPVTISKILRISSRPAKPVVMIVVAPSSLPPVPRQMKWELMRLSSIIITRMTDTFSGTSSVMPSSFSTVRQ